MRVLHFLDSMNRGGAETQALDVCRNASGSGFELTIVASGGGGLEEEFRGSGAKFYRLDRKLPVDPLVVAGLGRIIKENKIEVVQGYQAVEGIHIYLAAARSKRVKTVLSFQGFVPDKKNRLALKYLIPRMDANIVVSEGLQKWLARVNGLNTNNNFSVIYNGADPERLKPTGHSVRKELNIPNESLLLGMVANFYRDPRKDQLTIVKALSRIFADFPNACCLFAGKTEPGAETKLAECKELCKAGGFEDRVHFLGGRKDVPDILNALDLFIFSSLQEGLPVALTEAMLAKVPAVVSDIEPHIEASGNGKFAVVFKTQDADDLADKVMVLLNDRDKCATLADDAYAHAIENFSIGAHLRELKKLYERLLDD